MSGESAFERWLPVQSVETVLLSVISLLGEPNPDSPANVDAGVMWRNNRSEYIRRCRRLVEKANAELPPGMSWNRFLMSPLHCLMFTGGVTIPHPDTVPADRGQAGQDKTADERASMNDYYYDDYDDYYNYSDEDDAEVDEEQQGND